MNLNFFKEHFSLTRSQKNGILFLIILILLALTTNFVYINLFNKENNLNFDEFKNKIDNFYAENQTNLAFQKSNFKVDFNNVETSIERKTINPFYFNPNNLPEEKWEELGLTKKQIKVIKNFESKGGKFRRKEDLKRMYCISENEYSILEPYILIPEDSTLKKTDKIITNKTDFAKSSKNCGNIDINTADTMMLQTLKGIGSGFARKIVKYREKLGGFTKKEQLLEVWGMDNERYKNIENCITVGTTYITKINLNNTSVSILNKHPYIDMTVAKALIAYRNTHGKYKSVSEIKNCALMHDDLYNKIAPYLIVD